MRIVTTTKGRVKRISLIIFAIILGISTFAAFTPISPTKAATQWETDGWDSLSVGDTHTCGVSNGHAYCWGRNSAGQLGNSSVAIALNSSSVLPVEVELTGDLTGLTIKDIDAGGGNTCAIASDDQAYCWGENKSGQLGTVSTSSSTTPVAVYTGGVLNGVSLKSIYSEDGYTCTISTDDELYCWGDYQGTSAEITDPVARVPASMMVDGLAGKTVKQVAIGGNHSCALASDDMVYCWGSNLAGVLGTGLFDAREETPTAVDTSGVLNGKSVIEISETCALTSDNGVYCWGEVTGDGTTTTRRSPVSILRTGALAGKTIAHLSGNRCLTTTEALAYCWAYYPGDGSENPTAPQAVDMSGVLNGLTITSLSKGSAGHHCAIASNNQAYCWGVNYVGQLGNGSKGTDVKVPVAVTGAIPAPTINAVSFTTDNGKRLLVADGANFPDFLPGDPSTLVTLNGSNLIVCTFGGLSPEDIEAGMGLPAAYFTVSPPCYQLSNDTMDAQLYTSTQVRIWLPDGFDEDAEGTVQIRGGDVFTFNESSTPPADPEITAVVDSANPSSNPTVTKLPTFSGKAPAGSTVTVVVHSDPVSCTATADGGNNWSCTLASALPAGAHTLNITIETLSDGTFNLGPYAIVVAAAESAPVSSTSATSSGDRQVAVTDAQDTPTVKDPDPTSDDLDDSQVTPIDDVANEPEASKVEFPWIWLGVGVGALALIIIAVIAARRNMQS